jgi:hypothetical protein
MSDAHIACVRSRDLLPDGLELELELEYEVKYATR